MQELHVEAVVDGTRHTAVVPFHDDDFVSRFDCIFEEARKTLLKVVRIHESSLRAPEKR